MDIGDYVIGEIIFFDCEPDGLLTVTFRLESDPEEGYRELETDDYYYYAEELAKGDDDYMIKGWDEGDSDGEGSYYNQFDFREWLEYEHNERSIKEFIYEYYTKESLPELES